MTSHMSSDSAQIILVTGTSGAGRSTAINALEDLGFEVIDNLPMRLIPRLMTEPEPGSRLALGIDTRNRDFSTAALLELIDLLSARFDLQVTTLFLDASIEVLIRRYSETRRKHPLAEEETPAIGIERDKDLLAPVRACADTLLDTSDLNVHELRAEIRAMFGAEHDRVLSVSIHSFSYKRGLPRSADLIFDCRFLMNPYWQAELRRLDGRDEAVVEYIKSDARFEPFFSRVLELTRFLLPAYRDEGKSYLSIAFGCTGGQHRSVALAESLAQTLALEGQPVSVRHRELQSQHQD